MFLADTCGDMPPVGVDEWLIAPSTAQQARSGAAAEARFGGRRGLQSSSGTGGDSSAVVSPVRVQVCVRVGWNGARSSDGTGRAAAQRRRIAAKEISR